MIRESRSPQSDWHALNIFANAVQLSPPEGLLDILSSPLHQAIQEAGSSCAILQGQVDHPKSVDLGGSLFDDFAMQNFWYLKQRRLAR